MVNMKASNAKMLSTLISAMGSDRMGASIDSALRSILGFDMSCGYFYMGSESTEARSEDALVHILSGGSSTI